MRSVEPGGGSPLAGAGPPDRWAGRERADHTVAVRRGLIALPKARGGSGTVGPDRLAGFAEGRGRGLSGSTVGRIACFVRRGHFWASSVSWRCHLRLSSRAQALSRGRPLPTGGAACGYRATKYLAWGWWQMRARGGLLGLVLEAGLLADLEAEAGAVEELPGLLVVLQVRAGRVAARVAAAAVLLAEQAVEVGAVLVGEAPLLADAVVPELGQGLGHLDAEAVEQQVVLVAVGGEELGGALADRGRPW